MARSIRLLADRPINEKMEAAGKTVDVDEASALLLIEQGMALPADDAVDGPVTRVPPKGSTR
jgi:hypothetical protein